MIERKAKLTCLNIHAAMAMGSAAKTRLCGIMPVVPATDYGCESESCRLFNKGYLLTQGMVKSFWQAKLSDPDLEQHHHYVSPLRCVLTSRGLIMSRVACHTARSHQSHQTNNHQFTFTHSYRAPFETLGALPPMLLMTAGLDPLRDEGEAFAARAQEAGVPVELVRYEQTIHGFFGRVVTNGNCGVMHAAQWFDRVCGGDGLEPEPEAPAAVEEEQTA